MDWNKSCAHGIYNTNGQIKFETSILKSRLCDYSHACTLRSGTIKTDGEGAYDDSKWLDERNKGIVFKNCAPFKDCILEMNDS